MSISLLVQLQIKKNMKRHISLVLFLYILLQLKLTNSACVFLSDCPGALKYIEETRSDPQTIRILQNAHCGFEQRNGVSEPKTSCEKIPVFPTLPQDCVLFYDCPAAIELLETRRSDPETIRILRSATCGDSKQKDMILCNNVTSESIKNKHQLLPNLESCGLQMPFNRIFGGQYANLDDFKWIALLKYKNKFGAVRYGCHGSLINNKYIVTAAHCFTNISEYTVVLGEYDVRTAIDCIKDQYGQDCGEPIQEFSIESIRVHPKFLSDGIRSDIALIRLNETVTFSEFIQPICLPLKLEPLKINEPLWIAGWGKIENGTMSNVKLKANIKFLSKDDCRDRINYIVDDTQICAGSDNGTDSCKGDSGGPLMVQRLLKDDFKTFLVGIVSFGLQCGSKAAVYTNVIQFTEWILNNIEP